MRKQKNRILLLATMMATLTMGALYPVLIWAGSLEPSSPPGSTMKTLDQIPPTWSQTLPASSRFELVMGSGAAVLDKETGLVWEQSASGGNLSWPQANAHCVVQCTGGRCGWRLPTVEELQSLKDPTQIPPHGGLPPGHPFSNTAGTFWTATNLDISVSANAVWCISFSDFMIGLCFKTETHPRWCVRGGQGNIDFSTSN